MNWFNSSEVTRALAVLVGLSVAAPAFAGPSGGPTEGLTKRAATGDFFFTDLNYDNTWNSQIGQCREGVIRVFHGHPKCHHVTDAWFAECWR